MKKYLSLGLVIIGALFLAGCDKQTGSPTSSPGKRLTANEAYKLAVLEAKKFSSDSYLVNISTVGVEDNGRSRTWYILFYSPNKNTNYKVNVVEGQITGTSDTNKKKQNQVADNWIDTDRIAKVAIPQCGQVIESEYFFDLDAENKDKISTWSVQCTVGENKTLSIDVNALSGEYIRTRKAGIGW
jgi:hypothetical protein